MALALVTAVLTLGLPLLSYRSVTSLTQGQQQVGAGVGCRSARAPVTLHGQQPHADRC